jgi:EmrB/QacA subfamily drug resistance transporter
MPETSSRTHPNLWAVLAVVVAADIMDLLDASMTNIAAPVIEKDLGGGHALISWLGASYALALGVLLVLGGRLGDKYGQRRIFLTGITGFTLASGVCALAVSPASLIAGRLAQGAFGALLVPQGFAMLKATFARKQLTAAFSAFGPLLGVAAVGGPILGGFIVALNIAGLSWRPMFGVNLIIGSITFIAARKVLPDVPGDRGISLDGIGSGLLAATMFSLIYGLITGSQNGWTTVPAALLAAGIVFFGLFCWRQRAAANPLIKPTLLANRGFTSGLVLGLVFFAAVGGMALILSLFFQQGRGTSPAGASLGLVPMALGIVVASIAAAGLIQKLGRILILAGLLITLAGVASLATVLAISGTHVTVWALVAPIFVLGLGLGTCFGNLFDITIGDVAVSEAGSASGSLAAVQQLATSIGTATLTTVYFTVLTSSGGTRAIITSLTVIAAVTTACLALVWLLPRKAATETALTPADAEPSHSAPVHDRPNAVVPAAAPELSAS